MDIHKTEHTGKTVSEPSRLLLSPIVELRQYTLHPGQRDVLIELFERIFIEPQEAVGITVIGQFRDLEDPNRFVWLRGFETCLCARRRSRTFMVGQSGKHIAKRPTPR